MPGHFLWCRYRRKSGQDRVHGCLNSCIYILTVRIADPLGGNAMPYRSALGYIEYVDSQHALGVLANCSLSAIHELKSVAVHSSDQQQVY